MKQNHHLKNPTLSFTLVGLQFTFIGILIYLLFIQTAYLPNGVVVTLQILSGFIAIWAALHLQQKLHFNIVPDPMPNRALVDTGPYQYIRHPMYFSLLLFFTPEVVYQGSPDSVLTLLLLTAILVYKLHYEEQLLSQQVMLYKSYQHKTKKLIPFIY